MPNATVLYPYCITLSSVLHFLRKSRSEFFNFIINFVRNENYMDMARDLLEEIERGTKNAMTKKRIITYYMYNRSSTIPDLSKELDLSIPTVTKFIGEMCDEGYIMNYGKQETSEGRPPTLYGLTSDSGYFVGVDIKRFSLNFSLMNFVGDFIELKMGVPYEYENTVEGLDLLCKYIHEFIDSLEVGKDRILNIGINISGRVNPESGYSFSYFNFDERPLSEILAERFGFPVTIDNDTRAMTYGEMVKGAVKDEKNIVFINMSWGLGSGLIINGDIYTGKSGFSGEIGHFPVFDNEILCHCGKTGCLETEVSGMALHRNLLKSVREGRQSILSERIMKDEQSVTLDDIVEAINKEDLLCIELVEEIGQKMGRYLAGLINLLNPELVVIGGVLAETGDYILQPIKSAVRKYSLNLVNKDSAIVLSKLKERAGVIGACMLARKSMFES